MSPDMLSRFVEATAREFGIPGVGVGVWSDGREANACHGVTSGGNPLPGSAFAGQRGFFTPR